jgi:hypothetical protein
MSGSIIIKGAREHNLRNIDITILSDYFRTLLHQLMTAQIRVHDLDLAFLEQEAKAG